MTHGTTHLHCGPKRIRRVVFIWMVRVALGGGCGTHPRLVTRDTVQDRKGDRVMFTCKVRPEHHGPEPEVGKLERGGLGGAASLDQRSVSPSASCAANTGGQASISSQMPWAMAQRRTRRKRCYRMSGPGFRHSAHLLFRPFYSKHIVRICSSGPGTHHLSTDARGWYARGGDAFFPERDHTGVQSAA